MRVFIQSLHSEDFIPSYVDQTDTIADVKKTFEGADGRSLMLEGRELDDTVSVEESGIVADCTIEWSQDLSHHDKSPESGFMASNVSGAFMVSRDGSVTSARRGSCPAEEPEPAPAAAANVCTHWLEGGTCPFEERCHFSFTHTEENAGREHAVCLAGKAVCKHWVSDGACPLKSCFWKATHTPQNSPRYAKYLKATPMPVSTNVVPPKAPPNGTTVQPPSARTVEPPNGQIIVMKRQVQAAKTHNPHKGAAPITVMKRHQHAVHPRNANYYHGKGRGKGGAPLEIKDPSRSQYVEQRPRTAPFQGPHHRGAQGQPMHPRDPRAGTVQRPGPLPASYVHKKPQPRENGGRNRRGKHHKVHGEHHEGP